MSFKELIKKNKTSAPVHRSFDLTRWTTEYEKNRIDEHCDDIFHAGLIIHRVLTILRSCYQQIPRWNNRCDHILYLIGIANRDATIVEDHISLGFRGRPSGTSLNALEEFKIRLKYGGLSKPDEIGQTTVDSLTKAIATVMELAPEPNKQGDISNKEKLIYMAAELNICGIYLWIESLWQDCLWNGYKFKNVDVNHFKISPAGDEEAQIIMQRVATEYRRSVFQLQTSSMLSLAWHRQLTPIQKIALMPINLIQKIEGAGKVKKFVFTTNDDNDADLQRLEGFAAKDMVALEYYEGLLEEKPIELSGNSVSDLLNVWLVLRSVSAAAAERLSDSPVFNPNTLLSFAPKFNRSEICKIVSGSTHLSFKQSSDLIEFLTFNGKKTQTLWTQPLVPVDKKNFVMATSSIQHAAPLFVLEGWLSQTSVDISKKGNPFEVHIRDELYKCKKSAHIKDYFRILLREVTFNPGSKGERKEEIDLVFALDDIVFVCELKCSIVPTEALDFYNHRKIIEGAVSQVSRKADCASRFLASFRRRLDLLGMQVPEKYSVRPLVITNNLIHSGYPIDGVPIVDLPIIERFLEGRLVELASANIESGINEESVLVFYEDLCTAKSYIYEYFKAPPQLRHINRSIKERVLEVPARLFDPTIPRLEYCSYEANVSIEETRDFLELERKNKIH